MSGPPITTTVQSTVIPIDKITEVQTATTQLRGQAYSALDTAAFALESLLLARLVGTVRGDAPGARDRTFHVKRVLLSWPNALARLEPPCCAISNISTTLDDMDEVYDETSYDDVNEIALLSTEASGVFGLDMWGVDKPERIALIGGLAACFRGPGSVGGNTVLFALDDRALPIVFQGKGIMLICRLRLSKQAIEIDSDASATQAEWRARAEVEWDAEIVSAEAITTMDTIVWTNTQGQLPPGA